MKLASCAAALLTAIACADPTTPLPYHPGDDPSPPAGPAPAVGLLFMPDPIEGYNMYAGFASPMLTVRAVTASGQTAVAFHDSVTISLDANATSAVLTGTTTVQAVAGVATFDELLVTVAGSDFHLHAHAGGLQSATSPAFTVWTPAPRMVFAACAEWITWQERYPDAGCSYNSLVIMHDEGPEQFIRSVGMTWVSDPAWSPDGSRIAFTGAGESCRFFDEPCSQVFVVNVDGTGLTQLTSSANGNWDPSWSPDGTRLAFSHTTVRGPDELVVVNADGSGLATLGVQGLNPSWSPDGSHIAYAAAGPTGMAIHLLDLDGTTVSRITDPGSPEGSIIDSQPAWSPDGKRIGFVRRSRDPHGDSSCQVFVMDADGTNVTQLTNDASCMGAPAWSPDGSTIAYNGSFEGAEGIMLINADGTNSRLFRQWFGGWSSFAWAPLHESREIIR